MPRNPDIVRRNAVIYAQWARDGMSLTALAAEHHLSRQVIGRIVAAEHPEGPEDEDRALFRGCLWRLFDEVGEIAAKPGHKLQPSGRVAVDEDGCPELDTNVQVQARELQVKIVRELRLLDGRDRQPARRIAEEEAQRQADAALEGVRAALAVAAERHRAELEQARRAVLPVVAGVVIGRDADEPAPVAVRQQDAG